MKNNRLFLFFAAALISILFYSCANPLNSSNNAATVTVFFDNGSGSPVSQTLPKGSTIPSSVSTEYYRKNTHHFLFWSKSKATYQDALAGKIDENTPINESMVLYGIYAPKIATDKTPEADIDSTDASLEIWFQDSDIFSLNNNELFLNLYMNVKNAGSIVHTSPVLTNYKKSDLGSEEVSNGRKTKRWSKAYLSIPIPSLPSGSYTLSITNNFSGEINVTNSDFTVSGTPTKATNPVATAGDSCAEIKWDLALGTTYTVNAKCGGITVATKTNCVKSAAFYGLKNGATYDFEIITENTDSDDKTVTVTEKPAITKQTPEWVLAMYMDGDNNLHDPIFQDLNEVEYGLWLIENDPAIKTNYNANAVKAVALWDGWAGNTQESPYWKTGPGSYLYELGPEKSTIDNTGDELYGNQVIGDTAGEYTVFNNLSLSKETTKNLSYTARDWLLNNQEISTITESSGGEVNMGDKQTLINFINWVKERYAPTKGIILQFSNHGGGPRNAPNYAILPNGNSISLDNDGRKALCWDEGSNSDFLKTQDVSDALSQSNFKSAFTGDKLILMDVCLGASIEDAYQFKDYADYIVASPSTIPGNGMNYIRLMQAFKNGATMESIGKQIVADYAKFYEHYGWNTLSTKWINKPFDKLTTEEKDILDKKWAGFYGVSTLSLIKLSKINDVAEKFYDLVDKLNALDMDEYNDYLASFRKDNISLLEQNYRNTSLTYEGSFTYLYDIGRLMDAVKYMEKGTDSKLEAIYDAATDVQTELKDAIVSSWRDTYRQSRSGDNSASMYSYLKEQNASYDFAGNYYGLTIAGYAFKRDDNNNLIIPGTVYQWYIDDLAFGRNEKWAKFLANVRYLQETTPAEE